MDFTSCIFSSTPKSNFALYSVCTSNDLIVNPLSNSSRKYFEAKGSFIPNFTVIFSSLLRFHS